MAGRNWDFIRGGVKLVRHRPLRICFWGRLTTHRNRLVRLVGRLAMHHYQERYGIELDFAKIGGGLLLMHPFDITVNSRAELGEQVTLFKGCTVGSVRSGKREGVPKIGNRVCICPNAFVCGNITIGDDVLIAANAMVDVDVPSHSIVLGNPAMIIHKDNASKDYLTGL